MENKKGIYGKITTLLLALVAILCIIFVSSCADGEEADTDTDISNRKPTEGLEYLLKEDDTYEVVGIGTATETDIVIPSTYNDKIVTSIADEAFSDCRKITSIAIPGSITDIGKRAFEYCNGLNAVYIDDISAWCKINFDYTSFSRSANPLYYAENLYLKNKLVTDLVIPSDVTKINDYAFYYCKSIKSITIPNSITSIGVGAFDGCFNLQVVYIDDMSAWCKIEFDHDSANPLYGAEDLYLNGELVTDLVIPDDVTEIGNYAFYNCKSLTSVTIGGNVTSVGSYAFAWCDNLTNVTIGNSVQKMSNWVFSGCANLTSAIFENTNDWYVSFIQNPTSSLGENVDVTDPSFAAQCLVNICCGHYWKHK